MGLKHGLLGSAGLVIVVAVIVAVTAPPTLENHLELPAIDGDADKWIERREQVIASRRPITEGAAKQIVWHRGERNSRTEYAVVYLHGFSATRQEIAPVPLEIARSLGANLFETRLSGHGHPQQPLQGERAENWIADAAEALAVGNRIGDKLVVMGTSTGATLALAMLDFAASDRIASLVLLAPNFGTADSNSEFLTWPGGPFLARQIIGSEHRWEPVNDLQRRYWATAYPVEALVEMMRLVKRVRGQLPRRIDAALQVIYSPHDTVIDTEKMLVSIGEIDSPRKELVVLPDEPTADNPSMHVLTGDIMAPHNNELIRERVVQFVLAGNSRTDDS